MKLAVLGLGGVFRGELNTLRSLPVGKPGTIMFVQQNNNNVKVSTIQYERKSSKTS